MDFYSWKDQSIPKAEKDFLNTMILDGGYSPTLYGKHIWADISSELALKGWAYTAKMELFKSYPNWLIKLYNEISPLVAVVATTDFTWTYPTLTEGHLITTLGFVGGNRLANNLNCSEILEVSSITPKILNPGHQSHLTFKLQGCLAACEMSFRDKALLVTSHSISTFLSRYDLEQFDIPEHTILTNSGSIDRRYIKINFFSFSKEIGFESIEEKDEDFQKFMADLVVYDSLKGDTSD